jgi:hypothetical protein
MSSRVARRSSNVFDRQQVRSSSAASASDFTENAVRSIFQDCTSSLMMIVRLAANVRGVKSAQPASYATIIPHSLEERDRAAPLRHQAADQQEIAQAVGGLRSHHVRENKFRERPKKRY